MLPEKPKKGRSPREGGILIAQVHQLSGRIFAKILKKHHIHGLNPAQGRIVYALWKASPLSQTDLAEHTRLDKSTLALMLDRLEASGQVTRLNDPADARRKLVTLTDKNRSQHAAYAEASREMADQFYKGMPATEIEAFEASLRRILSNLDEASR